MEYRVATLPKMSGFIIIIFKKVRKHEVLEWALQLSLAEHEGLTVVERKGLNN